MPSRTTPLVTGYFYHIFNRGNNKQPIFLSKRDYQRAYEIIKFYSFANLKIRFSKFILLSRAERNKIWDSLIREDKKLVEFVAFSFMPNHFHFLIKQNTDYGISKFMGLFQNSYTKYFNTKYKRIGPILQGQFKSIRIEDENQLLHLSRYIHLNPYTSFLVKKIADLKNYKWSSFPEYLNKLKTGFLNKEIILSFFKNENSYRAFVYNQADYQRELEKIKHLTLEE